MATSATELAVAVLVAALFVGFASTVALEAVAVFDKVAPFARLVGVCTVMLNPALLPAGNAVMLQLTAPPLPSAGLVHVNEGPAVCDSETNVAPAGKGSLSTAFVASLGPVLAMVRL
jgi:hypothetical protein